MKKLLLLLGLLFLCSCSGEEPRSINVADVAMSVTHEIWFPDKSDCNSVVIGKHTILTASHCVDKSLKTLAIGSKDHSVTIQQKVYDSQDHVIVVLGYTFKTWTSIATQSLQLGQTVFIAGAPGDFDRLYRVGVYSGWASLGKHAKAMLFQLPIFYGDSGSAIFNQNAQIITTVTGIASLSGERDYVGFAYAYPLSFTKQQLGQIQ